MNRKYLFTSLICAIMMTVLVTSCQQTNQNANMEKDLKEFIKSFEDKYVPLYKEANLAYWNAAISGKKEDFDKYNELQNKITEIFSNKENFKKLITIQQSGSIKDSILNRELEVLYLRFLANQVDTAKLNAVNALQNQIEQKYGNFRANVNGKDMTDNEIEDILVKSTNSEELKTAYLAHKKIGTVVDKDIIKLVKMRNEIARELGFKNYHDMSLKLSEQNPEEISTLFDELDKLTKDSFAKEKDRMDEYFAKRYNISKDKLMPWHYQNRFFQEAPKIYNVDLDAYYKDKDLVKLVGDYYRGMNMPIDSMIKKSDLFEKPGKNQHAFCNDMDNEGDVRVLANVVPSEKWMNTLLHEFGHSAYDRYIDNKNLPFILRDPAHTFTTEAIAEMFGRFSSNADWMKDMKVISPEEADKIRDIAFSSLRLQQLVFSRWVQVMYRFEKSMYENPDQDLNKLWWDLVEKYQLLKKPEGRNEPDWASKIHIATFPCYYHNYLLGELLGSQLYYYMTKNILNSEDYKTQSFVNKPEIGKYLIEKVFMPGSRYKWNDMIEKATSEKLTPKYYANQFVN